jgi:hypothetical protein
MFRDIINVYYENHMKDIEPVCGKNSEICNAHAGGTYRNYYAYKG